jgi:hypothetical protein
MRLAFGQISFQVTYDLKSRYIIVIAVFSCVLKKVCLQVCAEALLCGCVLGAFCSRQLKGDTSAPVRSSLQSLSQGVQISPIIESSDDCTKHQHLLHVLKRWRWQLALLWLMPAQLRLDPPAALRSWLLWVFPERHDKQPNLQATQTTL